MKYRHALRHARRRAMRAGVRMRRVFDRHDFLWVDTAAQFVEASLESRCWIVRSIELARNRAQK